MQRKREEGKEGVGREVRRDAPKERKGVPMLRRVEPTLLEGECAERTGRRWSQAGFCRKRQKRPERLDDEIAMRGRAAVLMLLKEGMIGSQARASCMIDLPKTDPVPLSTAYMQARRLVRPNRRWGCLYAKQTERAYMRRHCRPTPLDIPVAARRAGLLCIVLS